MTTTTTPGFDALLRAVAALDGMTALADMTDCPTLFEELTDAYTDAGIRPIDRTLGRALSDAGRMQSFHAMSDPILEVARDIAARHIPGPSGTTAATAAALTRALGDLTAFALVADRIPEDEFDAPIKAFLPKSVEALSAAAREMGADQ